MNEKLNLLVIDDDEVDRMAVARALRKSPLDFVLREAHDGPLGLEVLNSDAFDCVLLDYRLPGDDGLDILRKIRSNGIRTPIIMLTRQGDEQLAVELMKAGASDYLTKDRMTPENLIRSVQYVIRSFRAEEQLQESRERYAVAVQGANDGIWDWHLKSGEIFFSPRWKSMIGFEEDQISGNPQEWWNRIHPDDIERVKSEFEAHLEGRTPWFENEHRILHCNGTYRWVLNRGMALRDSSGKPIRIAGSQTDITGRKLSEAERELLYQQALEADRRKDEFLSIVSHELRTPLTAILGWTQLLRSGKISETNGRRGLEVIENNARLQARIVDDLLDISQIIKGKLHLNIYDVNLPTILEMAIESVSAAANVKNVQIIPEIDPDVSPVQGDPDRLQQIAWNLIYNAIKFTPAGGKIYVKLGQSDNNAVLVVTDTGMGIRPEFLPYVFDRFRQEEKANTRSYRGLGLGLAIVRHLVELHSGTVTAESDGPGRGASFRISLPTIHAVAKPSLEDPVARSGQQSDLLNGLDVLIVEDDADTREVLIASLQHYGAHVHSAVSASEALQILRSNWPHVLVSDIAMPHEDGYSFIRDVRNLELENGKRIPSVAVTAYASSEDRTRALAAGYHAHVAKPIEGSRLASVIAELAGR